MWRDFPGQRYSHDADRRVPRSAPWQPLDDLSPRPYGRGMQPGGRVVVEGCGAQTGLICPMSGQGVVVVCCPQVEKMTMRRDLPELLVPAEERVATSEACLHKQREVIETLRRSGHEPR